MLVGRQRSHGCLLCRKRKIKCDETKPTCNNCVAYGKECPGYSQFVPLSFRDESQKVERLVRRGRRREKKPPPDVSVSAGGMQLALAPNPRQMTIPRFLLDSSWECHSHCYFRDQFTLPVEPDGSPGPLDSIPLLYTLCGEEGGRGAPVASLRAAMDAVAFASLANRAHIPTLAVQARRKYGEALRELSVALRSVQDVVRNETLGAIVMLMLFEDINSERNSLMSMHVSGIQYLLKLRGAGQLADPATRSLFHFAFTQMLIQFIGLKDPMQIDLDWLLEVLTIPHPIYNMMAANINISKLCASVSQILSTVDADHPPDRLLLASFLDRGEHLDLEFNQWHHGLPEEWMPRKVHSPVGGTMILYPDATAAGVWNYYRGTRIILHQTILDIQRHLDGSLPPGTSEQMFVLPPSDKVITQMIAEIRESLPFALGDVDLFGNPTPYAGRMQPSTKAVQGFALLWPIFSITQNEYASPTQKDQARQALKRIASTHGIRLGMDLGSETIQVERLVRAIRVFRRYRRDWSWIEWERSWMAIFLRCRQNTVDTNIKTLYVFLALVDFPSSPHPTPSTSFRPSIMAENIQLIKSQRNKVIAKIRDSWVRDNPQYDKPRLLLAFYDNPEEPRAPRVALFIIPKLTYDKSGQLKLPIEGTKYHVKNTLRTSQGEIAQPWSFEEIDFRNLDAEPSLLAVVVIGKVLNSSRVGDVLAAVPVYQDHMYRFSSRIWAQQAIELLLAAGITAGLYAKTALGGGESYLREKQTQGRWSARYGGRRVWPSPTVPILDMITGLQERI